MHPSILWWKKGLLRVGLFCLLVPTFFAMGMPSHHFYILKKMAAPANGEVYLWEPINQANHLFIRHQGCRFLPKSLTRLLEMLIEQKDNFRRNNAIDLLGLPLDGEKNGPSFALKLSSTQWVKTKDKKCIFFFHFTYQVGDEKKIPLDILALPILKKEVSIWEKCEKKEDPPYFSPKENFFHRELTIAYRMALFFWELEKFKEKKIAFYLPYATQHYNKNLINPFDDAEKAEKIATISFEKKKEKCIKNFVLYEKNKGESMRYLLKRKVKNKKIRIKRKEKTRFDSINFYQIDRNNSDQEEKEDEASIKSKERLSQSGEVEEKNFSPTKSQEPPSILSSLLELSIQKSTTPSSEEERPSPKALGEKKAHTPPQSFEKERKNAPKKAKSVAHASSMPLPQADLPFIEKSSKKGADASHPSLPSLPLSPKTMEAKKKSPTPSLLASKGPIASKKRGKKEAGSVSIKVETLNQQEAAPQKNEGEEKKREGPFSLPPMEKGVPQNEEKKEDFSFFFPQVPPALVIVPPDAPNWRLKMGMGALVFVGSAYWIGGNFFPKSKEEEDLPAFSYIDYDQEIEEENNTHPFFFPS